MEVIRLNFEKTLSQPLSVALGYFDGLHLGHQAVIQEAIDYAKTYDMRSAVMTFSPNPNVILKKLNNQELLTPYQEKLKRLKMLGVDELIILPFDEKLATMSPVDFIQTYLIKQGVGHVSTGFDFHFGRMGEGEVELLKTYSNEFSLNVTAKYELEDEKVGATQIKQHLENGRIEKATQMLGRPYSLTGIVIAGQQKGRQIGFPTANLQLSETYFIPKKGVYAVLVDFEGKSYVGMCNIGHNPTFNFNNQVSIETHILDFNEDIYGKQLTLHFYHYFREEQRFSSIEQLMTQLDTDRENIRQYFKVKSDAERD